MANGEKRKVLVNAGMSEYEMQVDARTTGSQLVAKVLSEAWVRQGGWLGLMFRGEDRRWRWLQEDKKVLSQKIKLTEDPIKMFLKVKIYPVRPSRLQDVTLQSLVYLQVKTAIEIGELACPGRIAGVLKMLAKEDKVMEYLETAEDLEDYGSWHFEVIRPNDPTTVRLSVSARGLTLITATRTDEYPFEDVGKVEAKGRRLVMKHVISTHPTTEFLGRDPQYTTDMHTLITLHQKFHQLNAI